MWLPLLPPAHRANRLSQTSLGAQPRNPGCAQTPTPDLCVFAATRSSPVTAGLPGDCEATGTACGALPLSPGATPGALWTALSRGDSLALSLVECSCEGRRGGMALVTVVSRETFPFPGPIAYTMGCTGPPSPATWGLTVLPGGPGPSGTERSPGSWAEARGVGESLAWREGPGFSGQLALWR